MYADPLDTTVPIRITMGACRFEHLAHHWGNPETVAEEVRRATHGDMVLWARQQQARVVPETVQLSGIRSQNVTPEYDDSPTEAMEPVRLVAEKDPLPWVQPSIEELKDSYDNLREAIQLLLQETGFLAGPEDDREMMQADAVVSYLEARDLAAMNFRHEMYVDGDAIKSLSCPLIWALKITQGTR